MVIVNGGGLSIPPYSRMIEDPKIVNESPSVDAFIASANYVGYESQLQLARTQRYNEFIGKYAQPELGSGSDRRRHRGSGWGFPYRDTGISGFGWWSARREQARHLAHSGRYPWLSSLLTDTDQQPDANNRDRWFEFGLRRVLDGIELLLSEHDRTPRT